MGIISKAVRLLDWGIPVASLTYGFMLLSSEGASPSSLFWIGGALFGFLVAWFNPTARAKRGMVSGKIKSDLTRMKKKVS